MDKTGTVTFGTPRVTDVLSLDGLGETEVLARAAAVERYSEHPVASAVLAEAEARGLALAAAEGFDVVPGEGVVARVGGHAVACGSVRLMERQAVKVPPAAVDRAHALEAQGRTVVYLAEDDQLLGLVAVADTLRPEVPEALGRLRALGVRRVLLLTGDNERVTRALAGELGVEYRAECLPEEKIEVVRRLQAEGAVVAMVGDGINDAPALAQADVGIAMGAAGTDAAIEAAHVALMRDDWRLVPEAIEIGRRAFSDHPAESLVHGGLQRGGDRVRRRRLAAADRGRRGPIAARRGRHAESRSRAGSGATVKRPETRPAECREPTGTRRWGDTAPRGRASAPPVRGWPGLEVPESTVEPDWYGTCRCRRLRRRVPTQGGTVR